MVQAQPVLTDRKYRRYYQRLEPLFKNRKTQAYFMVVMSLFTITFFSAFAIRPTLKTIVSLNKQIQDKSSVDERLDQKITSLIEARDAYQAIEPTVPLIYAALPQTADFPSLLRRIEIAVTLNQGIVSGIQFEPIVLHSQDAAAVVPLPTTNETTSTETNEESVDSTVTTLESSTSELFTSIGFSLSVQGDFQNLINLLDYLTKLDRLITIKTVQISGGPEGQATLLVGIQAAGYYFRNPL